MLGKKLPLGTVGVRQGLSRRGNRLGEWLDISQVQKQIKEELRLRFWPTGLSELWIINIQSFTITHSCQFDERFHLKVLPEYATCLG